MKTFSKALYTALALGCTLSLAQAQPKQFPLGSGCGSTTNGSECYNCASRQCSEMHPGGTYTDKTAYKHCIDQTLAACDNKFPSKRKLNPKEFIYKPPTDLKHLFVN